MDPCPCFVSVDLVLADFARVALATTAESDTGNGHRHELNRVVCRFPRSMGYIA